MAYYVVILGPRENPVYEAVLRGSKSEGKAVEEGHARTSVFGRDGEVGYGPQRSMHVMQMVAHAALDVVEELQWTSPHMYLKNIDRFHEWAVSCWVTPGRTRILLVHDSRNDEAHRLFLHDVWDAYVRILVSPLYDPDSQLGPAFDARVRASARKLL